MGTASKFAIDALRTVSAAPTASVVAPTPMVPKPAFPAQVCLFTPTECWPVSVAPSISACLQWDSSPPLLLYRGLPSEFTHGAFVHPEPTAETSPSLSLPPLPVRHQVLLPKAFSRAPTSHQCSPHQLSLGGYCAAFHFSSLLSPTSSVPQPTLP